MVLLIKKVDFISFIADAKRKTFASGAKPIILKNGGKKYLYKFSEYFYRDVYYGSQLDVGQEIIWFKEHPIWSMVYRGGMTSNFNLTDLCFSFLKECLFNVPSKLPIRGPSSHMKDEFEYISDNVGDIFDFCGNERILYKDKQIYDRNYLGGVLRAKNVILTFD